MTVILLKIVLTLMVVFYTFAMPLNEENISTFNIFEEYIPEQNYLDSTQIGLISTPLNEVDIINLSHFDLKIFGKPDNITTKVHLENFDPKGKVNPEELGTYLEGDILIPSSKSRNGMLSGIYRWPKGIIPYEIRGNFNVIELANIQRGFNEYHTKTCVRFIPRKRENDFVSIVNTATGCWSSIGRIGGQQELNVQTPGCLARGFGTFVHELMHALGFLHEQNRYERDNYIDVQYNNIEKKATHNFDKASPVTTYAFGVPYDYGSIMHYSSYAFSMNGKPTILPRQKVSIMGQRNGFSINDVKKINAMYKCSPK